ncbi:diglucosylglycerate octanoyltransferase [Nocardia neocaledoniensis]|uniref:diglucosylglycerate octanoyltransferase n=1 Tax=Nocardia neocaledoniensis TaxID=236511 RepID=UPI001FCA144D|nr:diglucosylglycerate octanoyltransferase [Nocardia neocaledoniensis]
MTAKAGRQLPDALFGPPPARPARPEREEPIRSVPDELFKQVTARSERSLPDALFGPAPAPVVADPDTAEPAAGDVAAGDSGGSSDDSDADADDDQSARADTSADADERTGEAATVTGSAVPQPDTVAVAETVDAVESAFSERSADSVVVADSAASPAASGEELVRATAGADSTAPQDFPAASAGEDRDALAEPSETPSPASTAAVESSTAADTSSGSAAVSTAAPAVTEPGAVEPETADADTSVVAVSADGSTAEVASPGADALSTAGGGSEAGAPVVHDAAAVADSTAVPVAEAPLVEVAEAPSPVSSASPRPVLLVIADSLAYYGPKGGLPADDPRIWPNMVAAELDWDVELIARIGWTCRDAYWALIGDPRVWAAVPRAGAVVFAVGGMDTLPSPLPTALRELIRYIRPPKLRRGVRASYNWLQPKLSKLGRPVALPPRVSVDYLEQSREALNHLRPELPVVAVLPSVHKCDAYGRVHRGRARAVKALRAWSGRTSVPLVDLGEAVRDDIESGAANPDGIHWGWAGHAAVATAMTKALQEVR